MPSALRFRPPHHRNSINSVPRTPKSPRGAWTGEPVPYNPHSVNRHHKTKISLAALILITAFGVILWLYPQLGVPALAPGIKFIPARPSLSRFWRPSYPFYSSSQAKQFVPPFPLYEMTFQDNGAFQRKCKGADRAWATMFPHGGGSIAVQNPREFGLPPSISGNTSDIEIYEVSVIRQLGCLVSTLWRSLPFTSHLSDFPLTFAFCKTLLRQILIDYEDHVAPQVQTQRHAFHCLDHGSLSILT